jgi:hypothetical protein
VVEAFVREPGDRLCLIRGGLRMVGYVRVGSPEALVEDADWIDLEAVKVAGVLTTNMGPTRAMELAACL